MASDLERQCERQRMGLEPLVPSDGGESLGDLMRWWLVTYSAKKPSPEVAQDSIRKHILADRIAEIPAAQLTSGDVEGFLERKSGQLMPQTIYHQRRFILTAINKAKAAGRFVGPNPVSQVARRKVVKRPPSYLRTDEALLVLHSLALRWRPLFATAIYTGLRKGELFGLKKIDVDLDARLLTVIRSHDRDTTKGGHGAVIPIAAELVPYLATAIATSPSRWVFPKPNGEQMNRDTDLASVLRRAMGRAGVVEAYLHVCRKHGCGHQERAADAALRRCPSDARKLWPKPLVRPIRFHDLRHTTASLLMMAGANPAAVQRIMRHSDPRITTEVYGHLAPEYLRAEVDRLKLNPTPEESAIVDAAEAAQVAKLGALVPTLSQAGQTDGSHPPGMPAISQPIQGSKMVGVQRFELWAPSSQS